MKALPSSTMLHAVAMLLAATAIAFSSDSTTQTLARHGIKEIVFAERTFAHDGHWYANFGYQWNGNKLYGSKGRLCKLNVATGEVTALIDDQAGAVRDPQVHYDGRKVLFSYRKGGTAQFHLYEINLDGTGLAQLTDGIYDDVEPAYLPDGGIMFVSTRSKRWVNCWVVQVGNLHRCDGDGRNIRVISVNIEQDNTPWVLPDGRVAFTRWEYVDRSQVQFHHLWTCNPDGTEQKVFYGNMHAGDLYIDAKPIPDSDRVVYIDSPGHGRKEHMGRIATVTGRMGPDAKESKTIITPRGNFRDPYALSDKLFLAADEGRRFGLVTGKGEFKPIYTGKVEVHEPRPVIKRDRERIIPSRVNLNNATGTLTLNNVYIGRNMKGVKQGDIKKLLILETMPKPLNFGNGLHDFIPISLGGTFTLERIIGTVPVEEDGSAHFEVPANRPLFLIAVNGKNETVKRMHSFLSVMPGETLSCIGCHEDRVNTPQTRPMIYQALKRAPSRIEPVPDVPYMIDYPSHVQPILDKHCVRCHSPDKPDGRIILTGDHGPCFSHSYVTLFGMGYVSQGENRAGNTAPRTVGDVASPLMGMLDGSHHEARLSPPEAEMIRNWIHIGAPYPGTYAALGTGMIRKSTLTEEYHPAEKQATAAFNRSCTKCHKNRMPGMTTYSIAGRKNKNTQFWDSHMAINLSFPEKSALLLAPLSREAGGWGTCQENGVGAIEHKSDPVYLTIHSWIKEGKKCLENNKRWDMPGFKPHPYYIREMKRYGILPETFNNETDTVDVFTLERKYFESSWHYPDGGGPKLYENREFKKRFLSGN